MNEQSSMNYDIEEQLLPLKTIPQSKTRFRVLMYRELIETFLFTLLIIWSINSVTGRFRIEGHSMMPTLEEGEYIIINKLNYYFSPPTRGDIIVMQFPNDRSRDFIKRIIGIPGDHIEVKNQQLFINDTLIPEPYIKESIQYNGSWDVPQDQFFVLGDNRNNSHDSHSWGFLPFSDIIGKAWFIYWSPEHWGKIPHEILPLN